MRQIVVHEDVTLAAAVAASSAFPPVLSPLRVDLGRYDLRDWPATEERREVPMPLPAFVRRRAVLTDGGRVLGDDNDGLVCLDGDGLITALNRPAADMLGIVAGIAPGHCSEVFAVPVESLFDAARLQRGPLEVPLWSGLRLSVLAQLNQGGERGPVHSASHGLPLKDVETAMIRKAVDDARGNVMEAARALGISRATVYRKLGRRP